MAVIHILIMRKANRHSFSNFLCVSIFCSPRLEVSFILGFSVVLADFKVLPRVWRSGGKEEGRVIAKCDDMRGRADGGRTQWPLQTIKTSEAVRTYRGWSHTVTTTNNQDIKRRGERTDGGRTQWPLQTIKTLEAGRTRLACLLYGVVPKGLLTSLGFFMQCGV